MRNSAGDMSPYAKINSLFKAIVPRILKQRAIKANLEEEMREYRNPKLPSDYECLPKIHFRPSLLRQAPVAEYICGSAPVALKISRAPTHRLWFGLGLDPFRSTSNLLFDHIVLVQSFSFISSQNRFSKDFYC